MYIENPVFMKKMVDPVGKVSVWGHGSRSAFIGHIAKKTTVAITEKQ
jgi:hypothetical protein